MVQKQVEKALKQKIIKHTDKLSTFKKMHVFDSDKEFISNSSSEEGSGD